jgi:signal transduction histidine kinase
MCQSPKRLIWALFRPTSPNRKAVFSVAIRAFSFRPSVAPTHRFTYLLTVMKISQNSFSWLDPIPTPCLVQRLDNEQLIYANTAAIRQLRLTSDQWKHSLLTELFELSTTEGSGIWSRNGKRYRIQEQRVDSEGESYKQLLIFPIEPPVSVRQLEDAQRLAGVLVHRLRSPLNGVIGFAEMLQAGDEQSDNEAGWHSLGKGLHIMKDLLDELNRFTQPIEVQQETLNITQLIEAVLNGISADKSRRIEQTVHSIPDELQGDPVHLQFILRELLDNAFEASEDELAEIQLHLDKEKLQVTNTGPTLTQKERRQLFQPFYTTKARHLGLGLTQAWRYAEAMGWELYYEKQSNSTSHTFTLKW